MIDRYLRYYDGFNLNRLNNDATATSQTQTFTYDDAGRLQSADGPYGNRYWSYDKAGNRTAESKLVSGVGSTDSYGYPTTSNRLFGVQKAGTDIRSFLYDASGNLTSDTRSGTAYAMTISDAGRIAQVSVGGSVKANYLYDGRNRLAIRQTLNSTPSGTTHLIHDAFDRVIVETDGAGQALREYVWLDDLPVAVLDGSATPANPTLLWVHTDHLKRPELMTDATKAVKWKAVYEPFGTVSSITGAAANQMRFPGQWFQLEAGLAYNWNRHYDATTGRYTQPDPLGLNQGAQLAGLGATILASDAAPGLSLVANDNVANLSTIGTDATGKNNLASGLAGLMASRQGGLGPDAATGLAAGMATGLADTAGAGDPGQRVTRDGTSLYAYARQTPVMRTDPKGLLSGGMTPRLPNDLAKKCEENCDNEWADARVMCISLMYNPDAQNVTGGYKLRRRFSSIGECMMGLVSQRCGGNAIKY